MIAEFQGQYRWLSNFWPCKVWLDGVLYQSVEHAYQAAKTVDESEREMIRTCNTAGDAKRHGKHITFRPEWNDEFKLQVMYDLVHQKFFDNPELRAKLIATENEELVEGNSWNDIFWGVCRDRGQNHLGRIIMQIREELKENL